MNTPQIVYTPDAVIDLVSESLKPALPQTIFQIKGLYKQTSTTLYSGHYFGHLHSTSGGYELTVRVPEKIKPAPVNGQHYVFSGYLTKRARKRGHVELVFNVTTVEGREPQEFSRMIAIYQQKARQGYRDVVGAIRDKILNGERVKIARLYGLNGIVDKDVEAALNLMEGDREIIEQCYDFTEHRVSMGSPSDIEAELLKLDQEGYDLIAILRGGGSNLSVFDDLLLATTAVDLKTPLVAGIGHEVDKPFIQDIADKSCATPTTFGYLLRDTAISALSERRQSENEKSRQAQQLDALVSEQEQRRQLAAQISQLEQVKRNIEARLAQEQAQANQTQQKLAGLADELDRSNQQLHTDLQATQAELEQTRSQLTTHVARLRELDKVVEMKSGEVLQLSAHVAKVDRENSEFASALAAKMTRIAELEQENHQLHTSADNDHTQAAQVQRSLNEQIASLQQTIRELNMRVEHKTERVRFNRLALAGAMLLIVVIIIGYVAIQSGFVI